jgi:hypothetical protein
MARARARVRAGGPVRVRTGAAGAEIGTGASGSQVARRTSSSGASGARVVLGEGVVPSVEAGRGGEGDRAAADRTVRKSASAGRRSQRRSVCSTIAQSPDGPGWRWLGDGELGRGQVVGLAARSGEMGEVAGACARRRSRRSTRRRARPAATEATAAPTTRATSQAGAGRGRRTGTRPTRRCRPGDQVLEPGGEGRGVQPTVGGAATVSGVAGSGRGWARTGRCTKRG